jgi:hypothetical protein
MGMIWYLKCLNFKGPVRLCNTDMLLMSSFCITFNLKKSASNSSNLRMFHLLDCCWIQDNGVNALRI